MSSPLSRDNGYQYPPEPAPAPFNREIANALFGDIHTRILGIETKSIDLQDLIDDLTYFGIQRLDQAINPLIEGVQAQLTSLQGVVAQTLLDNSKIISDFQEVTAVNLEDLNDQIDEMQDRINTILAGNLPAANVTESTTRVFVTPAQRTEIGALRTEVNALKTDKFRHRGEWTVGANYSVGDIVSFKSGLFRCVTGFTNAATFPNVNANWSTVLPIPVEIPNLDRIQRMARLTQFRSAI